MNLNDDFLNRENKKNIHNTRSQRTQFNCAGYALNTFSWYIPKGYERHCDTEMVESMLKDFPDLRLIKTVDELAPDEYALAFRKSDRDFHYLKRGKNGHWTHKMGGDPEIYHIKAKNVFGKTWGDRSYDPYDGTVYLFAKKNSPKTQIA